MNCSLEEYLHWTDIFNFNIADHVKVPDAPGDYVLSFRWYRPPLAKPILLRACGCANSASSRALLGYVDWLRKLRLTGCVCFLRRDCEQTPQIWAGCADIRIE